MDIINNIYSCILYVLYCTVLKRKHAAFAFLFASRIRTTTVFFFFFDQQNRVAHMKSGQKSWKNIGEK